jgi:hypothetical protein
VINMHDEVTHRLAVIEAQVLELLHETLYISLLHALIATTHLLHGVLGLLR